MPNVNSLICDLADIIMSRKVFSTLSDVERYQNLTEHYCTIDKSSLFQKRLEKGGETKTLTYQLPWIQKTTGTFPVKNFKKDCANTVFS